jgi:branched-subunit amino acid ABC-type transport system permease component
MEAFLLQLAAGIATGGIYASVALAIVMIYQATHHVNFAQGEMATLSTFIALTMIQAAGLLMRRATIRRASGKIIRSLPAERPITVKLSAGTEAIRS